MLRSADIYCVQPAIYRSRLAPNLFYSSSIDPFYRSHIYKVQALEIARNRLNWDPFERDLKLRAKILIFKSELHTGRQSISFNQLIIGYEKVPTAVFQIFFGFSSFRANP